MKFAVVGEYFQKLEQTSSRLAMTELLAQLFKKASSSELSSICNLVLGQLNPPYIGTQFNIASALMIKVVARLLDHPESTIAHEVKKTGDIGLIIEKGTWSHAHDLTVYDVYKALYAIERLGGGGSQEEKIQQLTYLLKSLDPVSAKFVARIVLGKLRLGFSDMTLIDALSWMETGDKSLNEIIENAYNLCADIGLIAKTLKEHGSAALQKMHAQVGIPIRPAAAERLPTAAAIIEKLGPCVAQPKLDGFRLQIHLDKTHTYQKIHFYSRNLQDMSHMFPDLVTEIGKLDVETLICEGEAIVYDRATGSFLPFQETVKRKRKHDIEQVMEELPLQVFMFDVLYLNGKDVLDKTHEERRAMLLHVFKGVRSEVVRPIEEKKVTTAKQLEDYFTATVASGLEGLVVKRPDAIYQPGKRNFNWIKLKRQEEGHLEDTLDCVVLGYYAGEGKRATFGIGAFLVGVYNKKEDRFETIAKIGTGLKDDDWIALKKKCDSLKVAEKPKNVVCAKDLYPDVWTSPDIVVLVRADEITMSPVHAAGKTEHKLGYALRFPRSMGYRTDKTAFEATTVTEVDHLFKDQFKK